MAESLGASANGTTFPPPRSAGGIRTFAQTVSRMVLGALFGGRRNLYEIFGYEPSLTYTHFRTIYERQDIAHRLVHFYPDQTWSHAPLITETPPRATKTAFETAWEGLVTRLHLYDVLHRADVLASLGQYSVVVLGVRGQKDLALPLQRVQSADALVYCTAYSEEFAQITDFGRDPESPTFGQPLWYTLTFGRGSRLAGTVGPQVPVLKGKVHASRMLHIADHLLDDEVYGLPLLSWIYNRLVDLEKVVGGSAEMYYRDAKRRVALELRDGYTLSPEDAATLTQEAEEYQHDMRDFLRLAGVEAKNLSGTVASPLDHFTIIMDVIAGASEIPKRPLLGSEQGELASSQDARFVAAHVQGRQEHFAEPRLVRALIDRLIEYGFLPTPAQGYTVTWPNIWSLPETQQAILVKDYATALAQAVTAGQYSVADGIARVMLAAMDFDPDNPPEPVDPVPTRDVLAPASQEV